jgi:predicted O-methyltransferase YrrM
MTSDYEGMPLSVLEAMAAGLPVVAPAVGAIPAVLPPNAQLWITPAGEVASLADRLADLVAMAPDERRAIGSVLADHVEAHFSFEAFAARWLAFYERATAAAPKRRARPEGALARELTGQVAVGDAPTTVPATTPPPSASGGPMHSPVRKAVAVVRSLPDPQRRAELGRKIAHRAHRRADLREAATARAWSSERSIPADAVVRVDPLIAAEAAALTFELDAHASTKPAVATMGGAGAVAALYALTRLVEPATVVETGVAAGFSSAAFLSAMRRNGTGMLHSSDFPYPGLRDADALIGVVVPAHLRSGWDLHTDGDRVNLPRIVERCGPIGLLHYDSDKTRDGRDYALRTLAPKLSPSSVLVFDDIDDNLHFRDFAASCGRPSLVLASGRKHVGLVADAELVDRIAAVAS